MKSHKKWLIILSYDCESWPHGTPKKTTSSVPMKTMAATSTLNFHWRSI